MSFWIALLPFSLHFPWFLGRFSRELSHVSSEKHPFLFITSWSLLLLTFTPVVFVRTRHWFLFLKPPVFQPAVPIRSQGLSFPCDYMKMPHYLKQEEILVRIARELPALRSSFSAIKFEKSIKSLLHWYAALQGNPRNCGKFIVKLSPWTYCPKEQWQFAFDIVMTEP